MTAFRMRIDISRCIGCRACEVACVTANRLNPKISRNRVPYLESGKEADAHAVFAPYLCHQCEDPPCVPACPTGASFIAADGRVLVDYDLCIGCGMCVKPCPYDAREHDPIAVKVEKCDLCEGRVKAGLTPACFSACPARARFFEEIVEIKGQKKTVSVGDIDNPDKNTKTMKLKTVDVDPSPRLLFSGREKDLKLLLEKRPPLDRAGLPSLLWRGGAGMIVQLAGYAALASMIAMAGLRFFKTRTLEKGDKTEASIDVPDNSSSVRGKKTTGNMPVQKQ